MILWTTREWALLWTWLDANTALTPKTRANPLPGVIDAAQRAVLPVYRHRPRASLTGRHNRAHTAAELVIGREWALAAREFAEEHAARIAELELVAALHSRRLKVLEHKLHTIIEQNRPTAEQQRIDRQSLRARLAEREAAEVAQRTKTVFRLSRIDIVGAKGHQITAVKNGLPKNVADHLRFISSDDSVIRDPADYAVMFTSFIGHSIEARYKNAIILKRVHERSARAIIVAVLEMTQSWFEQEH